MAIIKEFVVNNGIIVSSGAVTLSGDGTANYHAATKQYVDNTAPTLARSSLSVSGGLLSYNPTTGIISLDSSTVVTSFNTRVGAVTLSSNDVTTALGFTPLSNAGGAVTGNLTITGHIIPSADVTYDLGSPTNMWRDLYIGPHSIYMNGKKILEDVSDTITFSTDVDQNLRIQTTGAGALELQAAGQIQVKGTLQIQSGKKVLDSAGVQVEFGDNIEMGGNKVTGLGAPSANSDAATKAYVDGLTSSDATIVRTTGTQTIAGDKTFSNNVIINGNFTVSGTTTTVNTETVNIADNIIELNSNFTSGVPTESSGFQVRRGDEGVVKFIWDEANDRFTMIDGAGIPNYLNLYTTGTITAGTFNGSGASLTGLTKAQVGLTNVEDKSSATIRGEITSANVTTALGFTPLQQGGGTNQGANKIRIGWHTDTTTGLLLHIDSTDFGVNWPINITKNAATATKLATARTINGASFDGSANISFGTDSVTEGSTNKYYTDSRARAAVSVAANVGLSYNSSTGVLSTNATNANTASTLVMRDASGNFSAGTITASLSGNATTASSAATATNIAITNDVTTAISVYPVFSPNTSGNSTPKVASTKLSFVPSTGVLSATSFSGAGTGLTGSASDLSIGGNAATATTASNISVSDITTNATFYPVLSSATSGNVAAKVSSTKFSVNASTGDMTVGSIVASGGLTFTGAAVMKSSVAGNPSIINFEDQSGTAGLEMGRRDGVASTPFIDFHSGSTATDYDVRMIVSGGNGASGNGTLNIAASSLQVNSNTVVTTANVGSYAIPISGGAITGSLTVSDNNISSIQTGVSAAGTTQGTAFAVTKDVVVVSTVAASSGIVLPTATAGMKIIVMNKGANALNVYPASGAAINSLSANTAFSLPVGGKLMFIATTATQWDTLGATFS